MAQAKKTRPKTAKPAQSASVMVRMDIKLKYSAELAARAQNRSLSSFIKWAIAQVVNDVEIRIDDKTIGDVVTETWSPVESERLLNLASKYPHLLSFSEELIFHRSTA